MPVISMFYGITVRMYREIYGKHHIPHIHAEYAGNEAVIDLDGNLLEGDLPGNKMKLVLAWITIHEDELKANWKLLSEGEKSFRIEPLR